MKPGFRDLRALRLLRAEARRHLSARAQRAFERAAVLAYLRKRLATIEARAQRSPDFDEVLRDRARQLEIIIHEIATGFFRGDEGGGSA